MDVAVDDKDDDSGFPLAFGRTYALVDCCATYFEAYRWILSSLQSLDLEAFSRNPVLRTLLHLPAVTPAPAYVDGAKAYDLVFDGGERKLTSALDDDAWPDAVATLDGSQLRAVKHGLTRSLAVVQGPPGTGKTHVGLAIMRNLLRNRSAHAGPVLVVCYTNHALDGAEKKRCTST